MNDFEDFYFAAEIKYYMGSTVISVLKAFNSPIKRDAFVAKSTLHKEYSLDELKAYYSDGFEDEVESSIFNLLNPSF